LEVGNVSSVEMIAAANSLIQLSSARMSSSTVVPMDEKFIRTNFYSPTDTIPGAFDESQYFDLTSEQQLWWWLYGEGKNCCVMNFTNGKSIKRPLPRMKKNEKGKDDENDDGNDDENDDGNDDDDGNDAGKGVQKKKRHFYVYCPATGDKERSNQVRKNVPYQDLEDFNHQLTKFDVVTFDSLVIPVDLSGFKFPEDSFKNAKRTLDLRKTLDRFIYARFDFDGVGVIDGSQHFSLSRPRICYYMVHKHFASEVFNQMTGIEVLLNLFVVRNDINKDTGEPFHFDFNEMKWQWVALMEELYQSNPLEWTRIITLYDPSGTVTGR
jgi:hypothetical protein